MNRPGTLQTGGTLTWPIHVFDAAGELVDADSTPAIAIRRGGVAVGDSVTVAKRVATTGIYDCSYTPASTTSHEIIEVTETVVVDSVNCINPWQFSVIDQILLVENYTPTGQPAVVVPDPADDAALCVVHLDAEDISNNLREGIVVTFSLKNGPAKSERFLDVYTSQTMTTDASGNATISLQRNDLLTPTDTYYCVTCRELGLRSTRMVLEASTYNLADLIE